MCIKVRRRCLYALSALFPFCVHAVAIAQDALLKDVNGDGVVGLAAFGDSITYGVGDGTLPGEEVAEIDEVGAPRGYPRRLSSLLNLTVRNFGVPGEELVSQGIWRIPDVVADARVDTLIVLEGSNDSVKQVSRGDYSRALQRVINVTRASGKQIVVATIPPPTGNHASQVFVAESYSAAARELSAINGVTLADVETLWRSTCPKLEGCDLYNLPEGLHPNSKGYRALAQIFAAALVGVDLLASSGASDLESALGLAPGAVIVRPPPSSESETPQVEIQ